MIARLAPKSPELYNLPFERLKSAQLLEQFSKVFVRLAGAGDVLVQKTSVSPQILQLYTSFAPALVSTVYHLASASQWSGTLMVIGYSLTGSILLFDNLFKRIVRVSHLESGAARGKTRVTDVRSFRSVIDKAFPDAPCQKLNTKKWALRRWSQLKPTVSRLQAKHDNRASPYQNVGDY